MLVRFNGVTGIVISSTPAQITTSVPATATTGPITVKVAGRTNESLSYFTICTDLPKPLISIDGSVLISSSATGNQWLLNGNIITNASGNTYNAEGAGSYTVSVNVNGCSSVSDPLIITGVEQSSASIVRVFPNPTWGLVNITLDSYSPVSGGEFYTITGMKVRDISFVMGQAGMTAALDMKE